MRTTITSLGLLGTLLGAPALAAECIIPNVLIVMDRSGSMDEELDVGGTKWTAAVDAVSNLVLTFESRAQFGIGLFPGGTPDDDCATGTLDHAVAPGQGAAIASLLDGADFRQGTPIGASITAIANGDVPGLSDPDHPGYVLLVTDGKENCDGDPEAAITALRQRVPEVKTFVVGFGAGVDRRELERLAVAGGTQRMVAPAYYQADDPASLAAALDEIADVVTGGDEEFSTCTPAGGSGGTGDGAGDGDGAGGGAGSGAGSGDDDGIGEPPTGCACSVGARTHGAGASWAGGLVLAAVALAFTRSRRHRAA